ncbi:hypothetical protein DRQ25_04685 [Candidatus Fermentibacteria bacterium]|nr:MAG: hypothetical protein DRQ25_04685 [Candidatus Fermentibacteria bacterium]
MRDRIRDVCRNIEEAENLHILFAVENGSRAWGMASEDSDYDVRFVFVRPIEEYITINKPKDVISIAFDKGGSRCKAEGSFIDIVGFDIAKFVTLLSKSNPTTIEWLTTDIVYYGRQNKILKDFALEKFSQIALYHHYRSLARYNYRKYIENNKNITYKRYLQIFRGIVNYPQLKQWACIHRRINMLRTLNNRIIMPSRLVDSSPTQGILVRNSVGIEAIDRSLGNVDRSIPISVCSIPALALEGSPAHASLSTTSGAGFAGVPWVNSGYCNTVLPCDRLQRLPEYGVRHPLNLPVAFPAESGFVQMLQVFDSYRGIIVPGKVHYPVGDLEAPGFGVPEFIAPELPKGSPSPVGSLLTPLEFASPYADVSRNLGDVSAKIKLFENLLFGGRVNRDCCEGVGADINPQNILGSLWFRHIKPLFEGYENRPPLISLLESELRKTVALLLKGIESFIGSILLHWKSFPPLKSGEGDNRIPSPCFAEGAGSGCVESDGHPLKFTDLLNLISLDPNILAGIHNKLCLKLRGLLNIRVAEVL